MGWTPGGAGVADAGNVAPGAWRGMPPCAWAKPPGAGPLWNSGGGVAGGGKGGDAKSCTRCGRGCPAPLERPRSAPSHEDGTVTTCGGNGPNAAVVTAEALGCGWELVAEPDGKPRADEHETIIAAAEPDVSEEPCAHECCSGAGSGGDCKPASGIGSGAGCWSASCHVTPLALAPPRSIVTRSLIAWPSPGFFAYRNAARESCRFSNHDGPRRPARRRRDFDVAVW
mmetsp:Transcript_31142/g.85325  ORF Transcript_31142/g.85325 Transcript_31142/m.85325 type:complete len:227 (+) Transcript_31142:638-1318(+)